MDPYGKRLVGLAEAYVAHQGISLWRVGTLAANKSTFFFRLQRGATCTTKTYLRVVQWFSDNWPAAPPAWPSDVPRPGPSAQPKKAA